MVQSSGTVPSRPTGCPPSSTRSTRPACTETEQVIPVTRDRLPDVLVFDVNETLTDMSPLAGRLADVGLPGQVLPAWFAGVLRDGVALTLAGGRATFADVAGDVLRTLLARQAPSADP